MSKIKLDHWGVDRCLHCGEVLKNYQEIQDEICDSCATSLICDMCEEV